MEDTVKKVRNYAWKTFAVLSVGAVIHLIVSFLPRPILFLVIYPLPNFTLVQLYPIQFHRRNFQTHTEDSKEYIQQMAALRGVSAADYAIMTGGPTRLIKAFFPAQPLLMPSL